MTQALRQLQQWLEAGDLARVLAEPQAESLGVDAAFVLAEAAMESGRLTEARSRLERIRPQREVDDTRRSALLCRLAFFEGDWDRAWRDFDIRLKLMQDPPAVFSTAPDGKRVLRPIWDGMGRPRHLTIMAEQGLGDTIQFARFVPLIQDRADEVTLVAPEKLHPFLSRMGIRARFLALERSEPLPAGTQWCSLCDLPSLLGLTPAEYHAPQCQFSRDPAREAFWARRLPPGRRIGIVWAGNPAHPGNVTRSALPEDFYPLLDVPNVTVVSLQKDADPGPVFRQASNFFDPGPELDAGEARFLDTAAILAQLDALVTIDSAIGHVAGLLRRPVHLLLARHFADWRWPPYMGARSIWYPNHHIHRQVRHREWREVVSAVCNQLT